MEAQRGKPKRTSDSHLPRTRLLYLRRILPSGHGGESDRETNPSGWTIRGSSWGSENAQSGSFFASTRLVTFTLRPVDGRGGGLRRRENRGFDFNKLGRTIQAHQGLFAGRFAVLLSRTGVSNPAVTVPKPPDRRDGTQTNEQSRLRENRSDPTLRDEMRQGPTRLTHPLTTFSYRRLHLRRLSVPGLQASRLPCLYEQDPVILFRSTDCRPHVSALFFHSSILISHSPGYFSLLHNRSRLSYASSS